MAEIGQYNLIKVSRMVDFGLFLDDEEDGDILLPKRYIPAGTKVGDMLKVFVYLDSEDRIIATTETPKAQAEQFACLDVIEVNRVGAFLDWGLPKDVLLPFREQKKEPKVGDKVFVFIYFDRASDRIVASQRYEKFLSNEEKELEERQEVELIIAQKTPLGFKVIIEQCYIGLIYDNEIFSAIKVGDTTKGYISKIREDGKIDVALQKGGAEKATDLSGIILEKLRENKGFLAVHDKTDPDLIKKMFAVSKKTFKKALGTLYRNQEITISEDGIYLSEED
ncbi:S1-like domain-containing RNA-binding protein [Bacteroidia bacterium]|nr:S1-like domain-containing RNA-binding protein [Bacteroidia bacterium]